MRLSEFTLKGLYGRFDHTVRFAPDERITIITAPNGFGKTAVINILYGVLSTNFDILLKHQFDVATIKFDSGHIINIRTQSPSLIATPDEGRSRLFFEILDAAGLSETWQYDPRWSAEDYRYVMERYLPFLERVGEMFFNSQTGEYLSPYDAQQRYADELPLRFRQQAAFPTMLQEVLSAVECHLIETQRLLRVRQEVKKGPSHQRRTQAVVDQNAADLASKIEGATRTYASESQRMDQSFPQRVLRQLPGSAPSEDELRKNLRELETKRQNLAAAGLVEASIGPFMTDYDTMSEASVRNVLNLYARDAAKKLETFDSIYARINLFLYIVNDHFRFKKLSVDSVVGMSVKDERGDPVPLSSLSSGEQHILVLIYDLLFKVSPNALILVDEPELSLHVSWQKRFIGDLQKIQAVQPMDVVVATHSPQIINDRWDLTVELGPEDHTDKHNPEALFDAEVLRRLS